MVETRLSRPWQALARLLTALLVIWAPFPGGPRPAAFLLVPMGGWLWWQHRSTLLQWRSVRRLGLIFLFLVVPILLSLPGSFDRRGTLVIAGAAGLLFLTGSAILAAMATAQERQRIGDWIAIALLLWIADGWIQYFLGQDILGFTMTGDGRVVGPFGTIRFSLFLAVLAPLVLWRALAIRPWLPPILYGMIAPLVFLGGARATWIMIGVVGIALLGELSRRRQGIALLILVLVGGIVLNHSDLLRQRLAQTMLMTTALDFQHLNSALSGRGIVWESAGRMLADRPWTGVGATAFKKAYDTYSNRPEDPFRRSGSVGQVYHAHQLYVAVAAETGWPGLLGVVGIWYLCIRWWREADPIARREAKPYAVGLLAAVFPLNSQPVLLTIWWFPILLLLLAMMLASLEGDRDSHVTPQPPPPVGTA